MFEIAFGAVHTHSSLHYETQRSADLPFPVQAYHSLNKLMEKSALMHSSV